VGGGESSGIICVLVAVIVIVIRVLIVFVVLLERVCSPVESKDEVRMRL